MNGYLLTIAVLVVTAGRLGDMFGRKRVFIAGTVAFALGSILSGAASDQVALIAGRVRTGPLAGGLLIELDWRVIFWMNLPIAALGIAIIALAAPEPTDPGSGTRVDWAGLATLSAAVTAIVLALVQSRAWGAGTMAAEPGCPEIRPALPATPAPRVTRILDNHHSELSTRIWADRIAKRSLPS